MNYPVPSGIRTYSDLPVAEASDRLVEIGHSAQPVPWCFRSLYSRNDDHYKTMFRHTISLHRGLHGAVSLHPDDGQAGCPTEIARENV